MGLRRAEQSRAHAARGPRSPMLLVRHQRQGHRQPSPSRPKSNAAQGLPDALGLVAHRWGRGSLVPPTPRPHRAGWTSPIHPPSTTWQPPLSGEGSAGLFNLNIIFRQWRAIQHTERGYPRQTGCSRGWSRQRLFLPLMPGGLVAWWRALGHLCVHGDSCNRNLTKMTSRHVSRAWVNCIRWQSSETPLLQSARAGDTRITGLHSLLVNLVRPDSGELLSTLLLSFSSGHHMRRCS
jgi:hypothetical protein